MTEREGDSVVHIELSGQAFPGQDAFEAEAFKEEPDPACGTDEHQPAVILTGI